MNLHKLILLLSVVLAFFAAMSGCEKAPGPLRLGTNVWPGYEPLYLARERGMLESNRVRLVAYPSASEVIRAFRNRSLDAAALTLDEAISLLDQGLPLKIVLVHDVSNGADMIIARPGIEQLADLKGRAIGVESGALGAYMITRALQFSRLQVADLKIKHLDVNQHEPAYRKGEIDAAVTFEPFSTRLQEMGAQKIFSSRDIPGEIVDVLVVHEESLAPHLDDLRHLRNGWFKALEYLRGAPEEAAAIMAKRLKVSKEKVLQSYAGIYLPTREENVAMLQGDQAQLLVTLEKLGGVMKQNGLIQNTISYRRILTADVLQ